MILQYIEKALSHARYKIIEDKNPYYGEVRNCPGSGQPVQHWKNARKNLIDVIEGSDHLQNRRGLPIPPSIIILSMM